MKMGIVLQNIKKYWSIYFLAILIIVYGNSNKIWKNDNIKNRTIYWDVISYYTYLPAAFIHNDLKLEYYNTLSDTDTLTKQLLWPTDLENGNKVIKTTMGWAILNIPAFLMAHAYAKVFDYEANGYSLPYQFAIFWNIVLFAILGLLLLFKLLSKYVNLTVANFCILILATGTNFLYYAACTQPITHIYSFFLITLFCFISLRWFEEEKTTDLLLLGIIAGLITLIRPTNVIIILIPLFYNCNNSNYLTFHINWIKKHYKFLFIAVGLGFLILLPQIIYWKQVTGSYLFNSYVGEKFFWGRPMIFEFLFSYRKGWFLYTPIMLLMCLGFIIKKSSLNNVLPSILLILTATIWINSSWWCWWFGGSFGARSMVDFYGLLAIPLAIVIERILNSHYMLRMSAAFAFIFLIYLNVFQTRQRQSTAIHHDSMTKQAYWQVFLKRDYPENYEALLDHPDYESALKGKVVR